MSNDYRKKPKRVVILGAGFGGVYTFMRLHKFFHKDPEVALTLVNRHNYFLFTPLLHEVATGGVAPENILEPLRKVSGCCLEHLCLADVARIGLRDRQVETTEGIVPYDYLVIGLGGITDFYNVPGAEQYSFTLKSLADAIGLKNHFIETFERAAKIEDPRELDKLLHFTIVGGGPTGVELAAEMSEFFHQTFASLYRRSGFLSRVRITLLQRQNELLPRFSSHMRQRSLTALQEKGVDVRLGVSVVEVTKDYVELDRGERLPTATTIWVAGTRPARIPFDCTPPRDKNGRLIVDSSLQLQGHPNVFALGDVAAFRNGSQDAPLPPLAQVATRQASAVAHNIHRLIRHKEPKPFIYRHSGDLISLGHWRAAGELSRFKVYGRLAWWVWRTVYLSKLISWQKKAKVALDWTVNLISPRDVSKLYQDSSLQNSTSAEFMRHLSEKCKKCVSKLYQDGSLQNSTRAEFTRLLSERCERCERTVEVLNS